MLCMLPVCVVLLRNTWYAFGSFLSISSKVTIWFIFYARDRLNGASVKKLCQIFSAILIIFYKFPFPPQNYGFGCIIS